MSRFRCPHLSLTFLPALLLGSLEAVPAATVPRFSTSPSSSATTSLCSQALWRQGTEILPLYRGNWKLLESARSQGIFHDEEDFFEVTTEEAKAYRIDLYQLNWARTVLRDHASGIALDLLVSRLARAVGRAAAISAGNGQLYSGRAAAAFFLLGQHPGDFSQRQLDLNPTPEYSDAFQLQTIGQKIFGVVPNLVDVARKIVDLDSDDSPAAAEQFLADTVYDTLQVLAETLGRSPHDRVLNFFRDPPSFVKFLERLSSRPSIGPGFVWQQHINWPAIPPLERTLFYWQGPDFSPLGSRLLLPTFNIPAAQLAPLEGLVVAKATVDSQTLGQALQIDDEMGANLREWVKGAIKVWAPLVSQP